MTGRSARAAARLRRPPLPGDGARIRRTSARGQRADRPHRSRRRLRDLLAGGVQHQPSGHVALGVRLRAVQVHGGAAADAHHQRRRPRRRGRATLDGGDAAGAWPRRAGLPAQGGPAVVRVQDLRQGAARRALLQPLDRGAHPGRLRDLPFAHRRRSLQAGRRAAGKRTACSCTTGRRPASPTTSSAPAGATSPPTSRRTRCTASPPTTAGRCRGWPTPPARWAANGRSNTLAASHAGSARMPATSTKGR